MNKWVKKSVALANANGYLDGLFNIYPVNLTINRKIAAKDQEKIKKALAKNDSKNLIKVLLGFKKFPIDDPYVGFIRKDLRSLEKNPATTKRIAKILFSLGFKGILSGISRPESPSRQMGHMFQDWLYKIGYPVLEEKDFIKHKGVAILRGGDKSLKDFAKAHLGFSGQKGLDLIIKKNEIFVIGEAKLITTSGGTQDKSFRETMNFIKSKNNRFIKIAVLDGVVWLATNATSNSRGNLYSNISNLKENQIALSALLLKDFINGLK